MQNVVCADENDNAKSNEILKKQESIIGDIIRVNEARQQIGAIKMRIAMIFWYAAELMNKVIELRLFVQPIGKALLESSVSKNINRVKKEKFFEKK